MKLEVESTENNSKTTENLRTELVMTSGRFTIPNGNPPALIRLPMLSGNNSNYYLNAAQTDKSLSDGDLSDFSLNDTEEDDEEYRNTILLNGNMTEGMHKQLFFKKFKKIKK